MVERLRLPRPLPVRAAGGFAVAAGATPADLRAPLKAVCPLAPRRIGRFTELTLNGALRALDGLRPPADTPVWLATGSGYVAATAALIEALQVHAQSPMPVDFINVSGNAAGFYLAQLLGFSGQAHAVSSLPFAFESALELAARELCRRGGAGLVGGVDECAWPLAQHSRRLGVPVERSLGEGSHWLLLGETEGRALGELLAVGECPRSELGRLTLPAGCRLACGWGVEPQAGDELARELGIPLAQIDRTSGYRETFAAEVIADFFVTGAAASSLLYVDAAGERCSVVLVRRES